MATIVIVITSFYFVRVPERTHFDRFAKSTFYLYLYNSATVSLNTRNTPEQLAYLLIGTCKLHCHQSTKRNTCVIRLTDVAHTSSRAATCQVNGMSICVASSQFYCEMALVRFMSINQMFIPSDVKAHFVLFTYSKHTAAKCFHR